jgi:DNA-binding MarR family transcriptional regulator
MPEKEKLIEDAARRFTKVHNKLNKLEKKALRCGARDNLFAAELHAVQAIGKNHGGTVGELSDLFGITKGAVSQIITKLKKKKCISKARNRENVKKIDISLTAKGWQIFRAHEDLHHEMDGEFMGFMETLSPRQINDFSAILLKMEKYLDTFLGKNE